MFYHVFNKNLCEMTRNFVCHVQMSKYMYKYKCQNICIKNQDIYLLKSYTSVSSKRSKAILRFLPNVQKLYFGFFQMFKGILNKILKISSHFSEDNLLKVIDKQTFWSKIQPFSIFFFVTVVSLKIKSFITKLKNK